MRLLRHDLHILTGAYALDAIDGAERDRFEHHLRRCRSCGNEVRGLADTATALAMAVAMTPPSRLKQRVLAAATVTRQVPPPVDHRRLRRAARSPWVPRLAAAVAVVSLAVAVALGVIQVSTQDRLDSARAQNQAIAAVLAAPDAQIVTWTGSGSAAASVVVSRAQRKIVFTSAGLPPLTGGKVYELWLIGPPRVRSAGLLPPASAGKTAPLLASGLVAGDTVAMTVEPAGGTSQPTTTPILTMTLPGA